MNFTHKSWPFGLSGPCERQPLPVVYAKATITTNLTLSPQARRDDSGPPDLGWHYDGLDYVFGGCDFYANLTLTNGVTLAWYEDYGSAGGDYGQPYGLTLNDGAIFTSSGTVPQPNWITRFNTVQETVNGQWGQRGWMAGILINAGTNAPPQINAQFTKWSCPAGVTGYFRDDWAAGVVRLFSCEFYGVGVADYYPNLYFTNCLLFRAGLSLGYEVVATPSVTFDNCTFYGGALLLCRQGDAPAWWTLENNTFDGTAFVTLDNWDGDTNYTAMDHNAYNTGNTEWQTYDAGVGQASAGTLETVGPTDALVTDGYGWQSSWPGNFYLPPDSPLIQAGSTTADQLGLYEYTTQTNQIKQGSNPVDIGYHFVNFSCEDSWTYQYQNFTGAWISFHTCTSTCVYNCTNFQAYVTYCGDAGTNQGPY